MFRQLRDYNIDEERAFLKLFQSEEVKEDVLFEVIASKMYRHEYCLVGNDLLEEVLKWFEKAGLNIRIVEKSRIQTELELV